MQGWEESRDAGLEEKQKRIGKERKGKKKGKKEKKEGRERKERRREGAGWPAMAWLAVDGGGRRWPAAAHGGSPKPKKPRRGASLVKFEILGFLKMHFRERRSSSLKRARRGEELE